jgi:hypothetical protein
MRAIKGMSPQSAAASSERGAMVDGESGRDESVDGGPGGRGIAMGRLGFSVAEVGRGGRERTVDVSPGTRRTTSFWMLRGFWKHESVKNMNARGED